jgi:hypothetical protein
MTGEESSMRPRKRIFRPEIVITVAMLAALGGIALAAQDKYTVQVPDGLAFSEFRGYEDWQVVSISQDGNLMAAILANPVMIAAYLAGVPGNGKPFPDGAKMAKIHWNPKKMETFPAATVPGTLHDVDFMEKTATGSRTAAGGDGRRSSMTLHPIRSGPAPWLTVRRRGTTPSAGSRATRS